MSSVCTVHAGSWVTSLAQLHLALLEWTILSLCEGVSGRCGFTQAPLCTTTMVYGGLVHHQAQYAPPKRNVHHGAQGRLYFFKNSGCPDNFLFWWFTEYASPKCNVHHGAQGRLYFWKINFWPCGCHIRQIFSCLPQGGKCSTCLVAFLLAPEKI